MSWIVRNRCESDQEVTIYLKSGLKFTGRVLRYEENEDGELVYVGISTPGDRTDGMDIMADAIATVVDEPVISKRRYGYEDGIE